MAGFMFAERLGLPAFPSMLTMILIVIVVAFLVHHIAEIPIKRILNKPLGDFSRMIEKRFPVLSFDK